MQSRIETFKYIITIYTVTMLKSKLAYQEPLKRILGSVEIETIHKKIEGRKLKQVERNYLSRSIRPKLVAAKILCQENILEQINRRQKPDTSLIEHNLSAYGYEMISLKRRRHKLMAPEELIIEILTKSPKARFIEAIPFLLIKCNIPPFKLMEAAACYGIKNKLGYLIETACMLKPLPQLKELLAYLQENKDKEEAFLAYGDEEFLRRTSPKRVRKWNLLGRFFDEDFKKLARVYL